VTESILSAHEIDALRNAVDAGQAPGGRGEGGDLPRMKWGESRGAATGREDRLSFVLDRAAYTLERRMSDLLERAASVSITWLEITRFATFKETCELEGRELAIFPAVIPGVHGSALLTVEPDLAERVVEGLMGGSHGQEARERKGARILSGLDLRVTRRWVGRFAEDLGQCWNPQKPLPLQISGGEGLVAARNYGDSTPVVAVLFEVSLDARPTGLVGVVLPRGALDFLGDDRGTGEPGETTTTIPAGPFLQHVPEFPVDVEVVLGRTTLTVRDLLALNPGDTLALDGRDPPQILVQGVPKLVGTAGTRGGRKAIRVAGLIDKE
jgi:flagellar motor switch protein FliM